MIKPDRIGHVVIQVRDLARSTRFYSEVLGLQVMKVEPGMVFFASHGRDIMNSRSWRLALVLPLRCAIRLVSRT
ncbi:MAG: VOC family protein [Candidatus Binataceae bacterium]